MMRVSDKEDAQDPQIEITTEDHTTTIDITRTNIAMRMKIDTTADTSVLHLMRETSTRGDAPTRMVVISFSKNNTTLTSNHHLLKQIVLSVI